MSIASRITSIEGHIGDIYDSVELTGVDTTNIDKNLVNVPNTLKEGYIDIINNGTDTLYNNFPKVSGEGTSLTLNNTYQAPMRNLPKGNTSQIGTPTPTSPIPVNVVSGDNTITISNQGGTDSNTYNIDLPVENLFDKSTAVLNKMITGSGGLIDFTGVFSSDYIKVQPSTAYYVNEYMPTLVAFDKDKNSLGYIRNASGSATFTTPNNCEYIRARMFDASIDMTTALNNAMLEKGTKGNSYTPYGTTPIELCKIGNYQDYFYKDSDKWYLHKEIGKHNLTSCSYRNSSLSTNTKAFCSFLLPNKDKTHSNGTIDLGLSNNFSYKSGNASGVVSNNDNGLWWEGTSDYNYLLITLTDASTLAKVNEWLSANSTYVYYVLATPTTTEITDTTLINQLEEFYQAQSKNNQTNISQINNDLGFIISASALKKG